MISPNDASAKLESFSKTKALALKPESLSLLNEVLAGARTISQQETFLDPLSLDYMRMIEARLAQENLAYLAKDQVNGVWGGSTSDAFKTLAEVYKEQGVVYKGVIHRDLLIALIDGTRSPSDIQSKPNTYEWLKELVLSKGHVWQEQELEMNIVGIQGYLIERGGKVENRPNSYNDTIFLAWVQNGVKHVKPFVASVDPGRYYEQKPLNPKGCAHLCEGQYDYTIGVHRNYRALVQGANYVDVERWHGMQRPANPYRERVAYIGLNIHAGTLGPLVENASAGCQVILSAGYRGYQWQQFINLCDLDPNKRYKYTLIKNL